MPTPNTLDHEKAQRLLDAKLTVREVAMTCGVTTQAIYAAIKSGRLVIAVAGAA